MYLDEVDVVAAGILQPAQDAGRDVGALVAFEQELLIADAHLRAAGLAELAIELWILIGFSAGFLLFSTLRIRKRLD